MIYNEASNRIDKQIRIETKTMKKALIVAMTIIAQNNAIKVH